MSNYTKKVEKIMFVGWRRDMADMITELDGYVAKGSELWLFNTVPVEERNELLKDQGNDPELKLDNLRVLNVVGNPLIRRDLSRIVSAENEDETVSLDEFDSILILADSVSIDNGASVMSSDSRSLSTLVSEQIHESKQLLSYLLMFTHCRISTTFSSSSRTSKSASTNLKEKLWAHLLLPSQSHRSQKF